MNFYTDDDKSVIENALAFAEGNPVPPRVIEVEVGALRALVDDHQRALEELKAKTRTPWAAIRHHTELRNAHAEAVVALSRQKMLVEELKALVERFEDR